MNPYMLYIKAGILVAVLGFMGWQQYRIQHYKAALTDRIAQEAIDSRKIMDDIAKIEHSHAQQVSAIDTQLTLEKENVKTRTVTAYVNVHDGKLRDHFTCPKAGDSGVAASPGASGQADPHGLSIADGNFLVWFASEAQAVALQGQACQRVVAEDRK